MPEDKIKFIPERPKNIAELPVAERETPKSESRREAPGVVYPEIAAVEASVLPYQRGVLPVGQDQYQRLENILSDGLEEIYSGLSPLKQREFKTKGEETVLGIMKLISQSKIKIRKIINLIMAWLKIIPGANRFFLEQTAKIKADKILAMKEEEK